MNEEKIYGYFHSEKLEQEIWSNCIFIFDTSSLLDFYFFSKIAQDSIFNEIFEKINGRLWIPAQVEYEYLKNRIKTLRKPIEEKYKPLESDFLQKIKENIGQIKKRVQELSDRTKNPEAHPIIPVELTSELTNLARGFEESYLLTEKKILEEIKKQETGIVRYVENDSILQNFNKYIQVGNDFSFEKILEIAEEGEKRYRLQVSPGYKDAQGQTEKVGISKYGDLIIWKQILEFATQSKRPIVLIINDLKEDWCYTYKQGGDKRIDRPKEDLIKEIWDETNVRFWMYSLPQFIYLANKILKGNVTPDILKEVQEKASNVRGVIDQQHDYQEDLGYGIGVYSKYVGQIYQAGITGLLTGISVSLQTVYKDPTAKMEYPFLFSIYEVKGDNPTICLTSFQVNYGFMMLDDFIQIPTHLHQKKGNKYAIIISFYDVSEWDDDEPYATWDGTIGINYPNGHTCSSNDGATWSTDLDVTLLFRTYVIPK